MPKTRKRKAIARTSDTVSLEVGESDSESIGSVFADDERDGDFVLLENVSSGWITESEEFSDDYDDLPVLPSPVETRSEQRRKRCFEMRSAEYHLDGCIEKAGGGKDKTGELRGQYGVGGKSERTVYRKIKELKDVAATSGSRITDGELQQQINSVKAQQRGSSKLVQTSINNFLKCKSIAVGTEIESEASPPVQKKSRHVPEDSSINSTSEIIIIEDDEPPSSQDEEEIAEGELITEEVTDEANKWMDIVGEDMPIVTSDFAQLQALCLENLKISRKKKNYAAEVWYAALADLYRWTPQQGRIKASRRVMRNHGRGDGFARRLRGQARYFEQYQTLRPSYHGQRKTSGSLLDNEEVCMGLQRWLRTLEVGKATPLLLRKHVTEAVLPSLSDISKKSISLCTARKWMWALGFRQKRHSKGVYYDGHERKDVKEHRHKFLEVMNELAKSSATYEGDDMKRVPPQFMNGQEQQEVEFIYHDEMSVHANDYQQDYWLRPGEQVLKKKERGHVMMVSDFICQETMRLCLSDEQWEAELAKPEAEHLPVHDACVIIYPSGREGGDSYWNNEQMIAQLEKCAEDFQNTVSKQEVCLDL
ncbi:hypothetical protein M422DRAFT_56449 [Sphaerobolus stellatus SS14]|uniref:Uncharacterized protein n=1 Tax=Sphaerobolus stellatus (strain SS14) TaxID=990650 RepID=A0A0C9T5V8_SPHS4|nr:hypothetical protein M422DRAFT_56449 [Sphaerobolus stellatus SS14]